MNVFSVFVIGEWDGTAVVSFKARHRPANHIMPVVK
jgi:hypothetical protein